MITETPIKDFNSKLKNSSLNYPQCECGKCPKMFFNFLAVASRQSGKTYTITKLIKHYEDHTIQDNDGNISKIRTFVISPTVDANPILKSLKSIDEDDIYDVYTDDNLQDILNKVTAMKEESLEYTKYKSAYLKYMRLKVNEIHKLSDDELHLLTSHNFENYKTLPVPKWGERPISFVLLDDILGSRALTTSKRSVLMNAFIKNRHHSICFFLCVQSMKGIPKEIRLNSSVFFLGRFANKKMVLEDAYEEVSNALTMNEFEELYDYAINSSKYGSLLIDLTDGKRYLSGLDSMLEIK